MIEHVVGMSLLARLRDLRRVVVPLDPADGSIRLDFGVGVTVTGGGLAYATWDDHLAIVAGGVMGLMWLALSYGVYDAFFVTVKASARGLESVSPSWGWSIRVSIYRDGLESFAALVNSNIGRSPAGRTPKDFYTHTARR
jgi:hypothetical protein